MQLLSGDITAFHRIMLSINVMVIVDNYILNYCLAVLKLINIQ